MRDVLREKKQRLEAAKMRDSILDGFKDLIAGRSIEYQGSVREVIKQVRKKEQQNWE